MQGKNFLNIINLAREKLYASLSDEQKKLLIEYETVKNQFEHYKQVELIKFTLNFIREIFSKSESEYLIFD